MKYLISFLKDEREMINNAGKLFSGRIIIIILTLVLTPVISRIYSPEDYGHFSLFSTIIQVLVVIGTLSYPLAIISSPKGSSMQALRKSINSILISSILIFFLFYSLSKIAFSNTNFLYFQDLWYLFPIGFIISGVSVTFKSVYQREKVFGRLASVNIIESISAKTLNIGFGLFGFASIGLIVSDVASRIIGGSFLLKKLGEYKNQLKNETEDYSSILHKYPRIVMPSEAISYVSLYLITWYLATMYPIEELGKYWLAFGLTGMALNTLTNTLQPVVTQRVVDNLQEKKAFNKKALLFSLFFISGIMFLVLILMPEFIYEYYLGAKWAGVGIYIKLISVWYIFLLVDQTLENLFLVFQKEKKVLWLNSIDLALQLILILFAWQNSFNLYVFIGFFVGVKVAASILRVAYLTRVTSN